MEKYVIKNCGGYAAAVLHRINENSVAVEEDYRECLIFTALRP